LSGGSGASFRTCFATEALELVAHVVEGEEEAEVARHRRLGRDRPGDEVRHLALHLVDLAVRDDDPRRRLRVVADEGLHRRPDRLLDVGPHPEDVVLDLAHLLVERLAGRMTTSRGRHDAAAVGEDRAHLSLDLVVGQPVVVCHGLPPRRAQPNRPDT
jgi:hypothetical protein